MDGFEQFIKEKYKNEKTINGYIKDVEDFINYSKKEDIKIPKIKESDIKRYNIKLAKEGYSNHTIARKNSSLRLYFKFLRKTGFMIENPMEDIKQPTLQKKQIKVNEKIEEKIITVIKEEGNLRDMLLFHLLRREKIKLSEIIKLRVKDYNKNQGILYTQKKAIVTDEKTKELVNQIIVSKDSEEYILTNHRGKRLTEPGAYYLIKKYLREVNELQIRPIDLTK